MIKEIEEGFAHMKRVISLLLSFVCLFVVTSCAGSTTPAPVSTPAAAAPTASPATEQASVPAAPETNVAVFYYTYSDVYISSVRTALDAALAAAGIKYQNYDSNSNQTTQNEQIDTAISQGASMLIVNIVTAGSVDASQLIVDKAKTAGIPIVFFNRALGGDGEDVAVLGSYDKLAFVGTDAPEAGHMQGKMIGDFVVANYDAIDLNGDGAISYAMFKGQEGNVEAIYRTQYAVEDADAIITAAGKPALSYFDPNNNDKYQVDLDGNWSSTASNNYMVTNLAQFNESNGNMIELVICNNDGMAEGAISALNDKGYNLGKGQSGKTIPVFGVDATEAAQQLINDGKMTGTIKQDAEGMAKGIAFLAKNAADGKALLDGTDSYNKAPDAENKIYIPYGIFS
jgi:methyl-galactoside transport system substrate-binding protein